MNDNIRYSTSTRREYVGSQLGRYRPDEKSGFSLREIAWDVKANFGLEKPPSPATIRNDLHILKNDVDRPRSTEAEDLLEPERFPDWRRMMFTAPNGEQYETPIHQFAWFWLVVSLATRIPVPEWVNEWFLSEADVDIGVNPWIESQKWLMTLMVLAPPRHGKTDLFEHAAIWVMCKQPDVRIIWVGRTLTIAQLSTNHIKRELEANPKLVAMYGPFQREGQWADAAWTIATRKTNLRADTMTPLGKGTTVLSRDADLIFCDDIVDLKDSRSPTVVYNDLIWTTTQLFTRRETWTPVLGIGSHQPSETGDMYTEMERAAGDNPDDRTQLKIVRVKAHDYRNCRSGETEEEQHGEWCMLWPTIRPYWFLEAQRHDLGDVMFEVCYNQETREDAITYFREEVVRGVYPVPVMDPDIGRYRDPNLTINGPGILDYNRSFGQVPPCCGKNPEALLISIGFDPASGETRRSAESFLVVLAGCQHCGRRYLIDMWHKRISPETHPDTIDQYASFYPVRRVRIEINAYQKALARDPRLRESQSRHRFIIDEWTTDERRDDPILGVPVLSRHMEAGKFSVPYQHPQDRTKVEPLLRQFIRWPSKPNDGMFALWLADLSVSQMIKEATVEIPQKMPGWDDLPEYLQEMYTVDMGTMTLVGNTPQQDNVYHL